VEPANGLGVDISDGSDNAVGYFGFGSVISGNTGAGVQIKTTTPDSSSPSFLNLVYSNKIGTNAAGTAAIPNDTGIVIQDSSVNDIGSGDPATATSSPETPKGSSFGNANDVCFATLSAPTRPVPRRLRTPPGLRSAAAPVMKLVAQFQLDQRDPGNKGNGVELAGSANGNFVQSNLIGVQADGTSVGQWRNRRRSLRRAHNNVIGVEPTPGDSR
jgi:hypothetical protein